MNKETKKQEYITEEMIQKYMNLHKYSENGVVYTTNTKYFIKD